MNVMLEVEVHRVGSFPQTLGGPGGIIVINLERHVGTTGKCVPPAARNISASSLDSVVVSFDNKRQRAARDEICQVLPLLGLQNIALDGQRIPRGGMPVGAEALVEGMQPLAAGRPGSDGELSMLKYLSNIR